jgi:hypothetical protein
MKNTMVRTILIWKNGNMGSTYPGIRSNVGIVAVRKPIGQMSVNTFVARRQERRSVRRRMINFAYLYGLSRRTLFLDLREKISWSVPIGQPHPHVPLPKITPMKARKPKK